jgi:erythromycin esterase
MRILLIWLIAFPALASPPSGGPGLEAATTAALEALARPLTSPADLTPLLDSAGGARLVLLGESTHGTAEFYAWRAALSRRLITEKGFRFLAVEGDWADLYRLNRYVKDLPGAEPSARAIMATFRRWPAWMWANEDMADFIEWLREHNLQQPMEARTGIYGMDVYGDDQVLSAMLAKLARLDENLAEELQAVYGAYLPYAGDPGRYGEALARGRPFAAAARAGYALLQDRTRTLLADNPAARFNLLQSALVIQNAEAHYRAMHHPVENSWNARADHFFLTTERLLDFYGPEARGIVWAHNTHVGDARATPMAQRGERNIGMAARLALGPDQVWIVGFGTHRGTVIAGRHWGAPAEVMPLPPGGPGSVEALMEAATPGPALFLFDRHSPPASLRVPRGHRAVGVVYHPEREFPGNYVPTRLAERYDAFLFFPETHALRPVSGSGK